MRTVLADGPTPSRFAAVDSSRRSGRRSPAPMSRLRSMGDVYRVLENHPEAPEIRWALERLATLKGPLDGIPAIARAVRALLKSVDPTRDGIPHREFGRVKKRIGDALRHCGLEKMPARFEVPLLPAWGSFLASITEKQHDTIQRFARWSSMRGIVPAAVTSAHFDEFEAHCGETIRAEYVKRIASRLRLNWNCAIKAGARKLHRRAAHRPNRLWYTRGWSEYPPSLLAEIDRLFEQRRTCGNDPLSPWRAPINEMSEKTQRHQLRKFLHALCEAGHHPLEFNSLRDVITPANVYAAVSWQLRRRGKKKSRAIYNATVTLRSIARNWLRLPTDLAALSNHVKSLKAPSKRVISDRVNLLLAQLSDPMLVKALLNLGAGVLSVLAGAGSDLTPEQARVVQAALALDLLIVTAVDPTRLSSLRLGHEILPTDRASRARFVHPGRRGGRRKGQVIDLPEPTRQLLALYLDKARQRLHGNPGQWLFPGLLGRAKHVSVLSRQISALVEAKCHVRITPALFRVLIGYLHLSRWPGRAEQVRDLLGYNSVKQLEFLLEAVEKVRATIRNDASSSVSRWPTDSGHE